ncbi:hypothetical protein HMPREF9104_01232, partial [Lentilactobacillus kisonensis F0435]
KNVFPCSPSKSERSRALRNWNISLHNQKLLGLEFLVVLLIFQFLLCTAVLKSEQIQAVRNRSVSLLGEKFLGLEFFSKVLTCRFLPGGAVLNQHGYPSN